MEKKFFYSCYLKIIISELLWKTENKTNGNYKWGVVRKHAAKFLGKHLCVADLQTHECFPCKFWEIFKNTFFTEHFRDRSSYRRCSVKKGVLRNFAKFTGKHLCQRLFLIRPGHATLLKKSFWHRCFPVDCEKFLRTPFSQNTSGRLLLYQYDYASLTLGVSPCICKGNQCQCEEKRLENTHNH